MTNNFIVVGIVLTSVVFSPLLNAQSINENQVQALEMEDEELSKALDKWRNDFVRYIITDLEKREWKNLKTNHEKLQFIEFFWEMRDQSTDTPENEFRSDYLERWSFVQKNFTAGKPGWRTDRGRIYLMLGAPNDINRNPFGRNRSERPSETWYYNNINNKRLKAQVEINYVDFLGYGDYEIVTDLDRTAQFNSAFGISMNALDAYAMRRAGEIRQETSNADIITGMWEERKIRQPELLSRQLFDLQKELQEIARVPSLMVRSLKEQIQTEIARGDLTFAFSMGSFMGSGDKAFVPITLSVPLDTVSYTQDSKDRLYKLAVYARIHGDGYFDVYEEDLQISLPVETVEAEDTPEKLHYLYQFWFMAPKGLFDVDITLRDPLSKNIGHQKVNVTIPDFLNSGLALSDILICDSVTSTPVNNAVELNEARSFQFADRRVIPNVREEVSLSQESFFLYFHVYNFSVAPETGEPKLKLQYFLYRDGNLFSKTPATYIIKKFQNRSSVETKFDTKAFSAGEYRIVASILDEISGQEVKNEISFKVVTPMMKVTSENN